MTIEFSLTKKQQMMREGIRSLATDVIRPQALAWDRAGGVPEEFLRNMARLATSMGSNAMLSGVGDKADEKKKKDGNLFSALAVDYGFNVTRETYEDIGAINFAIGLF